MTHFATSLPNSARLPRFRVAAIAPRPCYDVVLQTRSLPARGFLTMPRPRFAPALTILMLLSVIAAFAHAAAKPKAKDKAKDKPPKPLRALIIDGQNNHDWKTTTPLLKKALESSGRFKTVDVATAPPAGQIISDFKPD